MVEPLVLKLIERQEAEGISGAAFARRLGITKSYWWKVSHGDQLAGRKIVDGALSAYPDLVSLLVPVSSIGNDASTNEDAA